MWQSLLVYNACPQPQTEATVLVSPSLLQIDTFGKWCRCLHNVCYVKLKKRRYLDKCRLSAPAGISALMSLLTNFFFAMCCSRQPFSIYLFRTNAFKFVYFFCKCHKLLFLENIFATFTSCCCGQFFWNNFIPANFSFCKFWQLFATDDYFQTLTPLKGFLATCYSVTKRLQQWVYLTWGIPKKIQSFSSQADPPP